MKELGKKDKIEINYLRWFVIGCVTLTAIAILYYIVVYLSNPEFSDKRGHFGDSFGGLTSLFSGFAFIGLIITIWMQADELRQTREEMKMQREAMERQSINGQLDARIAALNTFISTNSSRDSRIKPAKELINHLMEDIFLDTQYDLTLAPSMYASAILAEAHGHILLNIKSIRGTARILDLKTSVKCQTDINYVKKVFDKKPCSLQFFLSDISSNLEIDLTLYDRLTKRQADTRIIIPFPFRKTNISQHIEVIIDPITNIKLAYVED